MPPGHFTILDKANWKAPQRIGGWYDSEGSTRAGLRLGQLEDLQPRSCNLHGRRLGRKKPMSERDDASELGASAADPQIMPDIQGRPP